MIPYGKLVGMAMRGLRNGAAYTSREGRRRNKVNNDQARRTQRHHARQEALKALYHQKD